MKCGDTYYSQIAQDKIETVFHSMQDFFFLKTIFLEKLT